MAGVKLGPKAVEQRLARGEERHRIERERRGRARRIGEGQSIKDVQFWISTRDNQRAPWSARLQAAAEIEDRYGQPRRTKESVAMTEWPQETLILTVGEVDAVESTLGCPLHAYGLATDALVAFRSAARLDPSSTVISTRLREAERRLASGGRAE
jgi:hypothetical protein